MSSGAAASLANGRSYTPEAMKKKLEWLLCVVVVVLLSSSGTAPSRPLVDGIEAGEWVNLIGENPTLANLKGRGVLLHFFGPPEDQRNVKPDDPLGQAYFPLIRKFEHDYGSKGLVILGFCNQSKSKVEEYLASYNVPYPVAIGGSARSTFGVDSPNHLILLDRNGETFWRGPCNGMWDGKMLKGLKGAKRLGEREALALHLSESLDKRAGKAANQCADGELAKALKTLDLLLANERTTPEDRGEAELVLEAIKEHVALLLTQIEACLEWGEVLDAVAALEVLSKELKKHDLGVAPAARLAEVLADDRMKVEIEAAELYEKIMDAYWMRGLKKNLARFQKLIDAYPNTRAAEKVRNLLQKH